MVNPADLGIQIPSVFVPGPQVDLGKWAVIACDQYTSDPAYWCEVRRYIGASPSTLDLILPEVYLADPEVDTKIKAINDRMERYLKEKILVPLTPGLILLDRQTPHVSSRKGVLFAIDLEKYDYRPGTKSLIRPTEETIAERLPPRIKIRSGGCLELPHIMLRSGGCLELPHIMLLLDDPACSVMEPLFAQQAKFPPLYDFDLMMGGGHLTGYHLQDPMLIAEAFTALARLIDPETSSARYGAQEESFLFAVGDGNHSLATAKACWEQVKQQTADPAVLQHHPARYCLVEVVNLYDPGVVFHPIHRLLFNVDADRFFQELQNACPCRITTAVENELDQPIHPGIPGFQFWTGTTGGTVILEDPRSSLVVAELQAFIDDYLHRHPATKIDYIHGTETTKQLAAQPGNLGLFLPPLPKEELFPTVIRDGVLPRKTFSMGEAEEKRFYFEARKIVLA